MNASTGIAVPLLAAVIGVAGAALGLWLTGLRQRLQAVVPFSAGILLGVALFGLLPELAGEAGWVASGFLFAGGYALLIVINRFAYPVCPTCAHDHDHSACASELHGFAGPLIGRLRVARLSGWLEHRHGAIHRAPGAAHRRSAGRGAAQTAGRRGAGRHSTGVDAQPRRSHGLVRAGRRRYVAGGRAGTAMAPHLGTQWTMYPLGVTAGWLFYLGQHAVHEEWKRRGAAPAFLSALAGMAGAAIIQQGAAALFR